MSENLQIEKEHYFDWAATSPCDEEILKESVEITLKNWGNPSSTHNVGKKARSVFEEARKRCADAMGVKTENIYFTSGGTESDQIALLSVLEKPAKGKVLISALEHPAIREQANQLKKCGWNVGVIPSDKNGFITPQAVKSALSDDTYLVCVMAVNNETGAIQPIYEIADVIKEFGKGKRKPKFHVDCVQAAGKIPLNLSYDGIDSAAFSAHKICGPRGIGILYSKENIESFLRGGGQEKNVRSGTENVLGAVAFSKCLEKYFLKTNSTDFVNENALKISKEFVQKLSELKNCTIVPPYRLEKPELYSPFVVQAAFKNIPGNVMLRALDSKGFYISTGSACSTKKASRPILEAMNVPSDIRETAVRFSYGSETSEKSIFELLDAVKEVNSTFNK